MTSAEPAPHRIVLASFSILEFEIGGQTYRIPPITRSQWNRASALDAPPAACTAPAATDPLAASENRFAKAPQRIAKGMHSEGGGEIEVAERRAAQLAIFAERSAPRLPIETLAPVEIEQTLVALVAQHCQLDPVQAAALSGALLAASSSSSSSSSSLPPVS